MISKGITNHSFESADLKDRRARSVLSSLGITAFVIGFLAAGTLEEAAGLGFAPVGCADILGGRRNNVRRRMERPENVRRERAGAGRK